MMVHGLRRNSTVALTALCAVQFVDVLGVTVVVTALPKMLADLNAPASSGSLVSGGYAMFFGGLLMLGARLGDRFGHRRAIAASLAVFAAGALLGAVADSLVLLTAARCLQGAAAATSVPSALRLLTTLTPEGPARRRAIAGWSAAGASAGAGGFAVGGVVTDLTSWRLVFWSYLPLAAALAAAILRSVPRDRDDRREARDDCREARDDCREARDDRREARDDCREARDDRREARDDRREARDDRDAGPAGSVNAPGAAVFTAAVMAVVVGATLLALPARRAAGWSLLLFAAVLAAAFLVIDRRAAAPLLPRAALGIPALRRGALGAFLNTAATSSAMTLATLYLQGTLRHSPLQAAAMLTPFSLAVVAGSALAAPVLRRIRPQPAMAAGLAVIAAANAVLIATAHGWALSGCVAAAGAGLGVSSVASTTLGTTVPDALRGTASGIINTAAQLGTAIGVAVLLLIAAATTGAPAPGTGAPVVAWAVAAAIAASGAAVFLGSRTRMEAADSGAEPRAIPEPDRVHGVG